MVKIRSNQDYGNAARVINHPAAVAASDLVIKSDLDSAISSLTGVSVRIPTDLDCSTNPNYPVSTAGQSYYVTVGGKIGGASGVNVNIGDQIICKRTAGSPGGDQATVGTHFFIVESNREQASDTILGVISTATQAEVNTGTVANKAVTPLTLQTKLNAALAATRYSTTIGNGTLTTFNITHGLNQANVNVRIRETASPFGEVIADINWLDANNISISMINPPTTNQFTVMIQA